jgi:galactokinase
VDPASPRSPIGWAARPGCWFRAPGRVNLIGDYTDYHDGFCAPPPSTGDRVVAALRDDGRVTVCSVELADEVDVAADGSDEPAAVEPAWGRYVAGVVRAAARRCALVGLTPPFRRSPWPRPVVQRRWK